MKRIATLLSLVILVACGNSIHENINEEMVKDSEQVIGIIESALEEDRDFTDREIKKLEAYQVKYEAKKNNPDKSVGGLTDEEERLLILVSNDLIDRYDYYSLLEEDREFYESTRKRIDNVIKNGTIFDD